MRSTVIIISFLVAATSLKAEVVLNFGDPEDFTDFEYAQTRRTIQPEFFSKNILGRLEKAVEKSLPDGVVLTLNFKDIDLAGRFEPWQRIPLNDVRMLKSRYPPSAEFSYRLVDENGKVLAEGDQTLKDLGYQDRYTRRTRATDPFYYEWRMLESWIKFKLLKEVEKNED
ncbi:MAG: DUF3016 domain-containing protein [Verrucomicrobia bacterium]|nr:DUF3016 domain-containing protein [Verrucomicrobiota bacterium]